MRTAREVAAHLLYSAVDLNTRYPDHTGCLGINGVLAGSSEVEPVRQALIEARATGEDQLRERFERAKAEGDLPETARSDALAAFVMAVLHGMAVQAKAGFGRDMLEAGLSSTRFPRGLLGDHALLLLAPHTAQQHARGQCSTYRSPQILRESTLQFSL